MTEPPELRLKRLAWRSRHRGCKETDLLLGRFADAHLATLEAEMLDAFESLIDEDDADIWDWLVEKSPAPDPRYETLLVRIRRFAADS